MFDEVRCTRLVIWLHFLVILVIIEEFSSFILDNVDAFVLAFECDATHGNSNISFIESNTCAFEL